jgi:hypothetical protein
VASGTRVTARVTERERDYLAAVANLFDEATPDQQQRVEAYERAMSALVAKYPDDTEAQVFHALAMVGAALPTDKTYARQLRAGAVLERLWSAQPDHPGLAHYIIHAYDYPALAGKAASAARRYANIAPAAAHALHMPSHTFTRVGMWNESVETNRRSLDAALLDSAYAEALHAADYMTYAFLQMRRDSAALVVVRQAPALAARFDPRAIRGAAPPSAGYYAIAAIPARYVLERKAWKEAAALEPASTAFPYADAVTWLARGIGAARSGDTARARVSVTTLGSIRERLVAAREGYWAEQAAIQQLITSAWLAHASGDRQAALRQMGEAATREDATEKAAVTPGPIAPAREQLAELLLDAGRAREALVEYRAALTREPNRYHTLDGARRAAQAAGDRESERRYARELSALTGAPR